MMEGISNEACSLAGHWGLGKLIALYDDNKISIDGHTEISFTEDVAARYVALGWHVIHVKDGNTDYESLRSAIAEAKKVTDKPTLLKVRSAGDLLHGTALSAVRILIVQQCLLRATLQASSASVNVPLAQF